MFGHHPIVESPLPPQTFIQELPAFEAHRDEGVVEVPDVFPAHLTCEALLVRFVVVSFVVWGKCNRVASGEVLEVEGNF